MRHTLFEVLGLQRLVHQAIGFGEVLRHRQQRQRCDLLLDDAQRARRAGRRDIHCITACERHQLIGRQRAVHQADALGLALVADFRITCTEARFSANFNRLGFHPGFGLSVTLPRLVGAQQAALLFYTGRRIAGDEAHRIGLADELVALEQVRPRAIELAHEIAGSAPIAVQSTRATVRGNLVEQIRLAVARESIEQNRHFLTEDFKEGVAAMAARRAPQFKGR